MNRISGQYENHRDTPDPDYDIMSPYIFISDFLPCFFAVVVVVIVATSIAYIQALILKREMFVFVTYFFL